MNWLLNHWHWLLGGSSGLTVIAVVAGLLLAPAATVKLLRELLQFVLDKLRQGIAWLRKPGSLHKAAFAAAIAGCTIAVFYAYQQNQRVVVIVAERDQAVAARTTAETALETERKTWQQQLDKFAEYQRQQTAALALAQQSSADAVADYEKKQARAETSNRAWWHVYEGRSDTCKAAQESLDIACKEVGKL